MSSGEKQQTEQSPQSNVVVGQFDHGARFDETTKPTIPPPPPGYAPNSVQQAAADGKPILMTQKEAPKWVGEDSDNRSF